MTFSFTSLAETVRAGAPLSPEDVLSARRWAWGDGAISAQEAETIFELNRLAGTPTPEWADFFVEAMTAYVVNRLAPRGYVDEANADWLIERIDRDGRVDTMAELELIVKVLETALGVPAVLKAYALRQIEAAVLTGEGPTRRGAGLVPGSVGEVDVALLRRLIFAAGGDGATIVSRDEAEMLWRLKEATLGAANAPGWQTLFVQALGNHLTAHSSYRPLDRCEAARLEAFVADAGGGVGAFLGRMARSNPAAGFRAVFGRKTAPAGRAADEAAAAAVTADEAAWLEGRITADGARDPLEEALLAFLEEESGR